MAGLVPAIHVLANRKKGVDARVKPGHDEAHTPQVTCRANQLRDFARLRRARGSEASKNKRREKSGFGSRFRAVRGVQSGREKISLSENRKSCTSFRRPASTRGAYASSRTLSAGCDGRKASRDERRFLRTEEDVWSWHPLAGAKSAGDDLPATVTKGHGHRGERGGHR